MNDNFSARRLDRASKHVSSLWFPINLEVLTGLRRRLHDGTYASKPELLFEDLKQDFALFTFIVKELNSLANKEGLDPQIVNNPVALLMWGCPKAVESIINDDTRLPLSHLLQSVSPLQANRLRETAIIASTAEVLSAKKNLDPDTGFSRGVIRETGLNLIAWNYPSLYSRIVKNLTKGQSLDEKLAQELGFSPVTLAMRVLQPVLSEDQATAPTLNDHIWDNYDQLCEVGAALARADNPEAYPSAENDWKMASDYLHKTVGPEGISLIKNKAIECSKQYKQALEGIFRAVQEFNPEKNISSHRNRSKSRLNRYVTQCAKETQASLQALYAQISEPQQTGNALEALIRKIIPEAGFTGGCIFLVDPAAFALMPRTVFGDVKLRPIERVFLKHTLGDQQSSGGFPSFMSAGAYEPDIAATALSCAQPLIERQGDSHGSGLTGMYASLGDAKKVGVLYLEAPESSDTNGDHQTMCTFKAMRQALADALKLD
jgi:hypothetical protein